MREKLLQAAILTLLLQMLVSLNGSNRIQTNSANQLRSSQTPIAILLHRLLHRANFPLIGKVDIDRT